MYICNLEIVVYSVFVYGLPIRQYHHWLLVSASEETRDAVMDALEVATLADCL